ncbi:MAG: nucleotidyl transferase AbiEii/AbiGii toxin family protein [Chlorobi bacterium]|nr:nucleotidyl transferase AbiEii/AbiGii toxin family protein [Chlorobiota bacterium]
MILLDTFKKEEILNSTQRFEKGDPSIVELVVHAFYLLEKLAINKLDFFFKGGTALMLYLDPPTRFSTDIDIITLETRERIESILDKICEQEVFLSWELEEHRSYKEGIPKAHYKLFFNSSLKNDQREILLDILFEENVYPVIELHEINLDFIIHDDEPIKIKVPPSDALLGDKLTAFAPGTTGIGFNKNKGRDIIKQVFDIGSLFDKLENIILVKDTFLKISEKEITYRKLDIDLIEIAKDVLKMY